MVKLFPVESSSEISRRNEKRDIYAGACRHENRGDECVCLSFKAHMHHMAREHKRWWGEREKKNDDRFSWRLV